MTRRVVTKGGALGRDWPKASHNIYISIFLSRTSLVRAPFLGTVLRTYAAGRTVLHSRYKHKKVSTMLSG